MGIGPRSARAAFGDECVEAVDNGLGRCVLKHDFGHAHFFQLDDILVRHDPAGHNEHIVGALFIEQFEYLREHGHLDAGQEAHAQNIDVLLYGGRHNLFGGAMQARINDVHSGVSQCTGHHLHAPVMAIKADLGEKDANGLLSHIGILSKSFR